MNKQVTVLSCNQVKAINAKSIGRRIPHEIIDRLDPTGFNVVARALMVDDGATMRLMLMLKVKDTMEPSEGIVDCDLTEYLEMNRVEVSFEGDEIEII
jgi:hypothetical protein